MVKKETKPACPGCGKAAGREVRLAVTGATGDDVVIATMMACDACVAKLGGDCPGILDAAMRRFRFFHGKTGKTN